MADSSSRRSAPELPKLVVLHVSPWSERVRWALDHHGIAYQLVQHAPFLGERKLRKLVGRTDGLVTVPVLVDDGRVIPQSWDIVAYADEKGDATTLIPSDKEAAIREWTRDVDDASSHGRALVMRAMLASPGALDESHPPQVPTFIRPLLRPVTRSRLAVVRTQVRPRPRRSRAARASRAPLARQAARRGEGRAVSARQLHVRRHRRRDAPAGHRPRRRRIHPPRSGDARGVDTTRRSPASSSI